MSKILKYLQDLNWDEKEMMFKYKAKKKDSFFGWGSEWGENPFSLFFDSQEKWQIHMNRIVEIDNERMGGYISKKEAESKVEKVHNEIILIIATNLLKRMKQIEISDEEKEYMKEIFEI